MHSPRQFPRAPRQGLILKAMRLLEALASIFINVFGITQPTPEMRRKAAWFILVLLMLTLLLVAAVGIVLYQVIRH
ncbi:MAG TPA: hypothetical protein VIJ79_03175 [Acidobacteriaceae bacterium]